MMRTGSATAAVANPDVVLVGTYKDRQLAWIGREGIYNYPVKDGDELTDEACRKIRELWLYADVKGTRYAFTAAFVGRMTRAEFLAAYPTYPKGKGSKNKAYYVFQVTKLDYGPMSDGQVVVVRAADFGGRSAKVKKAVEQYKADGAFSLLSDYLPSELAQVPQPQLRVCEPGVQMNFFPVLLNPVAAVKEKVLVLVGTYRAECKSWLMSGHGNQRKSYYNLPFHGTDSEGRRFKAFTAAFLFSPENSPILRRVRFVGIIDANRLKSEYDYPMREHPHADRYALFELTGVLSLREVRAFNENEDVRYVVCVDVVAKSRYKWIDVLSCYVSSTKIAFDGWALTNKIPRWMCLAAGNLPKDKKRICAQMDFLSGLGFQDSPDVWNNSVPVEKSSYLQEENIQFLNREQVVAEPGRLYMMDLFCGAGGGGSVGAGWSGFQPVFGVDHLAPAMETWINNHPHALGCLGDIRKVDPREVRKILVGHGIGQIDLITGGVPCQGFSRANRKHTDTDERNFLFLEYMRFVREFKPPYIILENVSGMRTTAGGHFEDEIKHYMEGLGYVVTVDQVNAAAYGVPQVRKRLLFVGVRRGQGLTEPYAFPEEQFSGRFRTVEEAISDLPPLGNHETCTQYRLPPQNPYQAFMRGLDSHPLNVRSDRLFNHSSPNHPQETIARIARTKPGEPMYPAFQQRIRLRLDQPSPTQLAGGIRPQFQFGHPVQARGLSIRERARIQSFPDSYVFFGGTVQERVQTGNAVPPLLIHAITRPIAEDLERGGRYVSRLV